MSLSTSSAREPFSSTIIGISSSMFILFNALMGKLSWFFLLTGELGILSISISISWYNGLFNFKYCYKFQNKIWSYRFKLNMTSILQLSVEFYYYDTIAIFWTWYCIININCIYRYDIGLFKQKSPWYKYPFKSSNISKFFSEFTNLKHIANCLAWNSIFVQFLPTSLAYVSYHQMTKQD